MIDDLPEPAVVDEAYMALWKKHFEKYEGVEPRVKTKRILMLPALRTLATLVTSKTIRLARVHYRDGSKTIGLDLLSDGSSSISNDALAQRGFLPDDELSGAATSSAPGAGAGARANAGASTSRNGTMGVSYTHLTLPTNRGVES